MKKEELNTEIKIKAFEYVVLKLRDWNEECSCKEELTQLKVMRMLFFVSGVNTKDHLFDIFDNFQAWQYGHNEGDIYKALRENKGEFSCFRLHISGITFYRECEDAFLQTVPAWVKTKIDTAVDALKSGNKGLICCDAFVLLDIDRSYVSYDAYYNKWKESYTKMDKNLLIYEDKLANYAYIRKKR